MYPCRACKKEFTGYNKQSLELDAKQVVGYFNFYLGTKYAVDDELYSFIVSSPDSSPARIAQHLQRIAADNYFNDYQYHLHAVKASKIRCGPQNVARHDRRQPTINSALQHQLQQQTSEQSAMARLTASLRKDIRDIKFRLLAVESSLDVSSEGPARNKLCFRTLLDQKKSRNGRDLPLPSIGEAKLRQLLSLGVNNAVELIDYEDMDGVFYSARTKNSKLHKWKGEAQEYFDVKRRRYADLLKQLKAKEAELKHVDNWSGIEASIAPAVLADGDENIEDAAAEEDTATRNVPELFSEMTETIGYNARFISSSQVNSILEMEFRHRKPMQEAKMMGLSADICKIDWSYKIAGKTYVYTGPGVCFRPYTSMLNVQNGEGLTALWKACTGGESLDPVKSDLLSLKNRNIRHDRPTKGIYIDDCCKYRNGLQATFGQDVWVKLDSFHWMKRWDKALLKPSSEKGHIFRAAMSRALFVTPPNEFNEAKDRLMKKFKKKKPDGWQPTIRQMLKEANSRIPMPETLALRVNSLIRYLKFQDAETDMQIATWGDDNRVDLPLRYFKNSRETESIIREQLSVTQTRKMLKFIIAIKRLGNSFVDGEPALLNQIIVV